MTNDTALSPERRPIPATHRDSQAAAEIATAAGRLLLQHRRRLDSTGVDPAEIRAAGDRLSHEYLIGVLGERFPGDAVLSEEGADDLARLDADRVWIVDPLDGTREFGEPGRADWAVHVALVENGVLTAGAVAMPALGTTYSTAEVTAPARPLPRTPRVVVSRTRRPEPVMAMATALGADLIEMGSAGAKAMAVVRGDADIYAHAGGQYEWDSAAPVAVARAAGLHVSRIDGSEPIYNQENPWLPDLLICRPELADDALEALRR
ncbi:3'(2'),5'-bisphosphate nucleotidase CysQ [Rhodococcus sp. D2-41]|uniref:3'(2'),5'-bisphosphate nucleotidase CysQ n=1 Tax=Speluncibacter jeojiensis TaxID=2710754 RepID=A0A9X4M2P1_9ACTN|nr:3'(2'),5'-bisphosphate nucleotidase CysQ [Rhodococcus sp. D2-41]MDG3009424.1 3'(2'),5'-bisphosphate nucleotidase CysQ [Rhodococcus sp. D2-41]MDG3016948.1 3'(2'),5'-bisphosphate nucleotidase CysQ [Corynebacteriales bacterium D3-21]